MDSSEGFQSLAGAAASAVDWPERRRRAAARSARPLAAAASEEAHRELYELLAEEGGAAGAGPRRAVGTALHRLLEAFDPATPPGQERERLRLLLPTVLEPLVEPADLPAAHREAAALLERVLEGTLLARLRELGDAVVARELPLLLAPGEQETGPLAAVTGSIDLLYRDPDTRAWVVADYKTDEVERGGDLDRRAAAYRPQGALYARAVAEALELPELPRFELWFLRPDAIVEVSLDLPSQVATSPSRSGGEP